MVNQEPSYTAYAVRKRGDGQDDLDRDRHRLPPPGR